MKRYLLDRIETFLGLAKFIVDDDDVAMGVVKDSFYALLLDDTALANFSERRSEAHQLYNEELFNYFYKTVVKASANRLTKMGQSKRSLTVFELSTLYGSHRLKLSHERLAKIHGISINQLELLLVCARGKFRPSYGSLLKEISK